MTFKDQIKDAVVHTLPIIGAFFAPALYVILLVVLITIVDTYLGIKAAKHKDIKFTSNRFSDFFAKLIGYGVFVCVGLLINTITGWKYGVWLKGNEIHFPDGTVLNSENRIEKDGWKWHDVQPYEDEKELTLENL